MAIGVLKQLRIYFLHKQSVPLGVVPGGQTHSKLPTVLSHKRSPIQGYTDGCKHSLMSVAENSVNKSKTDKVN